MRPFSGVNLTALDSRLSAICLSARRSARRRMPDAILEVTLSFFSCARVVTTRSASDSSRSSSTFSRSSLSRPASIFDMSRMSLMTSSRYSPLRWMSRQYSTYLSEPSAPNMPDSMISEKPMMALSGVRSSWLMLARNFDLAWLASSARLVGVASASCRACDLQLLLRLAQVGDGRHQPLLAVDQLLLVLLQRRDVGADRNVAAVLGAALADLQPVAVVELRLEGARAGNGRVLAGELGADDVLAAGRDHRLVRRAGGDRRRRAGCAGSGIWSCTAPGGCRGPTARRLPGWSRWRRAGACRPRRSARPASSAR